ncbi:MAG: DUF480 domain-containing protein [Planctomycetes bacterium]|nr:DUF480 domain-containing protein [Planctomycetota bacterium]
MSESPSPSYPPEEEAPQWQALSPIQRRIMGVLVEKAKTTPDAYPLSLNAIRAGCNQKSNRSPAMQLDVDDIEETLEELREMGAVGMIEGQGRIVRYRHYLYKWLGVDKVEMAVMAELLLRGAQTIGELRGRAARMEPIADLGALRPILASLKAKELVIPLTPEGRGHVITHGLYRPQELERLENEYGRDRPAAATPAPAASATPAPAAPVSAPAPAPVPPARSVPPEVLETLQRQLQDLQSQIAQLRSDTDDLTTQLAETNDQVQRLNDALGG